MKYADWPLAAPVNLTWEITHRCNLRCVHCLSASSEASEYELSYDECKRIVDELAALKVFEINFGGGEPLLKGYFLPLLRYIHKKGIVTCISTNGTCLTDEAIALFDNNPLVNVQVSLDGATAQVNDAIRGRGTFLKIIEGIEKLAGKDIPLSINSVVTSKNYFQLKELKELAVTYGANLRVSRFRPSGRARASWEALRLNSPQLKELADWLNSEPDILTGDSFFSISQDGRRQLGLDMCGACKMTCCIDPFGDVYPCAFLQADEFRAGSLRQSTARHSRVNGNPGGGLKDIWDNSSVFKYFRNLEPASCRSCPRFEKCRGGCPAVAYFINQDLNSADPECLANWSKDISLPSLPL
ncbi:MAG: mycofactocin radical SAM maturase [Dehalococcoidales bacterium]|nr:mycofactocin radical SAM maturase [Dehalococcoidales bacterium]